MKLNVKTSFDALRIYAICNQVFIWTEGKKNYVRVLPNQGTTDFVLPPTFQAIYNEKYHISTKVYDELLGILMVNFHRQRAPREGVDDGARYWWQHD